MIPYEPTLSPATQRPQTPALPKTQDVEAAAGRVLEAGERPIIKDNYEQRMDVFAKEMNGQTREFQAQLISEILERDPGAFESWLHGDRLNWMTRDGDISVQEQAEVYGGFAHAIDRGLLDAGKVDSTFVRDSHNPELIGQYLDKQNLNDRGGFENALKAFSGLEPGDMRSFINDPANAQAMQRFELAVQKHQDWFEGLAATQIVQTYSEAGPVIIDSEVKFSKEQLTAMRDAFLTDDKMHTNGELLLAYPDRAERNERVTQQYSQLSQGMADIVGRDNANWATFAQWASDEIGRNLEGNGGIALSEAAGGDPRFWLSEGNSVLVSDIGPAFQHFVDTFGGGKNRDMSFDQFWSSFESKFTGRELSYLDGNNDPQLDMKNAFKAYYESMQLKDREATVTDPQQLQQLQDRRGALMLYGNTLVGLQEQDIVDPQIDKGMSVPIAGTNPGGFAGWAIDFHLPNANGQGERRIDTDIDMPDSPDRVNFGDQTFVTADGKTITLGEAMKSRLNHLDGDPNNEDETNPANSGTDHWEDYSQRMGTIFHLFANYQRADGLFQDARTVFGSRAESLNNEPIIS